jgi:multiple sugar transport system substrate-binding protein
MKASGNTLDYSIMPFMALNQKTISSLTSGDVPDLVFMDAPETILPQNAWDDKIIDVSDVVAPHVSQLSETAKLCSTFYNKATKKRSYYLCPIKQGATPFHIWGDLVEKAGLKMEEIPKNWDGVWTYLKQAQAPLRSKGMRKVYACGLQITTVGPNDGNNLFRHFLIANGGEGIVTPDGKLHTDDPKIREAAIKSVEFMTNLYKEGVVPPEAMSWNDADDNNGYHEKLFLMDFDGTLSTELAMIKDKQAFYHDMRTIAPVNKNDGTPMKTQVNAGGGYIPKGAKNVEVAKDFMKYFMQPKVMNENLKAGLGRWFPAIPQLVKDDPFWLSTEMPCLTPYITEGVLNPTVPLYNGYSPAWGQFEAEQVWGVAQADVIKDNMKVADAVDKALRRCNEIFARITI